MRLAGPNPVGLQLECGDFLGWYHKSVAYVILGTATVLYSLQASFIFIPEAVLVNCLKAMVHLTAFSQTFLWCAAQVSLESSMTPSSLALGLRQTCTVFCSLLWE